MNRGQILDLAPGQGQGLSPEEMAQRAVSLVGGIEYRVYLVRCPGLVDLRLVDPNGATASLEGPLRDAAEAVVQLPVPDVNPTPEKGGTVNLGMWLAVDDATYDPISAFAGPLAWMTVTPTLDTTTFTFGNGDVEVCPGSGTPIVDLDTIDEGDCGYTYRSAGTYPVAVTATWRLRYQSSGGPGELEPLIRTVTFDYVVREVQTVGVSG